MSIYDIDYDNVVANLSPSQRRTPRWLAWMEAMAHPLQWKHDAVFTNYANGSSYPYYDFLGTTVYNKGDRVLALDSGIYEAGMDAPAVAPDARNFARWNNKSSYTTGDYVIYDNTVYQSLTATNKNNTPGTDLINWVAVWIKVCDSFIGVNERMSYRGQKVMLELALNRLFQWLRAGYVLDEFLSPPDEYNNMLSYPANTYVVYQGSIYFSLVVASGPFNPLQWLLIEPATFRQPSFYNSIAPAWSVGIHYVAGSVVNVAGIPNVSWVALLDNTATLLNAPGTDNLTWKWAAVNRSDIYIDDNYLVGGLEVFGDENHLGGLVFGGENPAGGIVYGADSSALEGFNIYVPNTSTSPIPGWYDTLKFLNNNDDTQTKNAIAALAYKYAVAGVTLTVLTY